MHDRIVGLTPAGKAYRANDPELLRLLTAACGTYLPKLLGQSMSALPGYIRHQLVLLSRARRRPRYRHSGALDFRVAEQELDSPKISRAPVDQGRLRPSQVPNSLGSSPMPPIHSPTRRAYWRVVIQLSVRRRLVNRNSPDFCPTLAGSRRRLDGFGRSA